MRSGSAISLGAALVFGAIAAFLARGLLQPGEAVANRTAPTRTMVVAAQTIGFGVPLTAENLREVPWPAETHVEGTFTSVSDLMSGGRRLALASLQRNEPILSSKVTGPNGRATLSTQIDEGMRAVSVRVDEVRGVAGFVLPGDRVDVIHTRAQVGEAGAYADVLLQNVKVLAIDQLANERQDKPTIARAVTLELTVQQAQKAILAQGVGQLALILRQAGEAEGGAAGRVTATDLGGGESAAAKDRVAELEKQMEEMRKAAADASARAGDGASQRIADMEQRLRDEMIRARMEAAQPVARTAVAPAAAEPVVNVIRNGSKREQYTIIPERR